MKIGDTEIMKECTILIQDEVNVKLLNLDAGLRRHLAAKFSFEVPGARFTPAVKLGRWNGKESFFSIAGTTYINLLPDIIPLLDEVGYSFILDDRRDYKRTFNFDPISETTFDNFKWPAGHRFAGEPVCLREDQAEAINKFLANTQCLQELATGFGKCQPLSSRVLTPSGWRTMADIQVGDTVVTPKGKQVEVLNTYLPGNKDVYELTFTDGRKARACGDHIWRVHNIEWKTSKKWQRQPWRNIATTEVAELLSSTKRRIGIPLVTMELDNEEAELPMDPWLMGFLLGDGSFRNGSVKFTSADQEMVDKVSSKLTEEYYVTHCSRYDYRIGFKDDELRRSSQSDLMSRKNRNTKGYIRDVPQSSNVYRSILLDLGLDNTYSHTKFIPEVYFQGSRTQRLELIRGLIDSDGTVTGSSMYLSTSSEQLARDFQRLIWSIGGTAKITHRTNHSYVYKGERRSAKDVFTVSTRFATPWELVSLTRKNELVNREYQYKDSLRLGIKSVELVSNEEVKCILIDDPDHLYVTDDYIVTHNTISCAAMSSVVQKYGRSLIVVPNKSLVLQTEADYQVLGLDVGVYYGDRKEFGHKHTVTTWQSLHNLYKDSQEGKAEISITEFVEDVVCLIIDEAHGIQGKALKALLGGPLSQVPIRWGMTGTVPKEPYSFLSLFCSIGEVVGKVSARELQEKGHLANCHVNVIQLVDYGEYPDYQKELKYLVETPSRVRFIANMIKKIKADGNTLVLVDRISTGKQIVELLGEDAVFVSGVTKTKDRKEEYDLVASSNDKIIVATYKVAAVGINIPRLFNVVLIEAGKSFTRVIQSIGRGLRTAHDKNHAEIYDITSTCKFSKRHLTKRISFYKDAGYPYSKEKMDWS